ncbi:uncharacterized protein LOC100906593 [Galendromus occidentalis]|uniref:Uncharacterized protein LOC100906593 n=1 Tax=Galendromus occidentalis TaxID=34638 RepID=A0AAJ7P9J1_9ACAR|nr:uncharacterized protein LOC100906593 [Galendromus occidentalis]
MLITSVKPATSSAPRVPKIEVIEISDDEDDEPENVCRAFSRGACRRQAVPKRDFVEIGTLPTESAKRLRISNAAPSAQKLNNGVQSRESCTHAGDLISARVGNSDENDTRNGMLSASLSREMTPTWGPTNDLRAQTKTPKAPPCSGTSSQPTLRPPEQRNIQIKEPAPADLKPEFGNSEPEVKPGASGIARLANGERTSESIAGEEKTGDPPDPPPAPSHDAISPQKQFLKPPSPKAALSKKDFMNLPLEDVDLLVAKYGSHIVQNITIKDIQGKGIGELNLPKNVKVTPQLKPRLKFKLPISADDEVIVISDDEIAPDNASQEASTDSAPDNSSQVSKTDFKAQRDFLANLQLFHAFKPKKPLKKDIANVLKTRNIMKAYIANPLVSILKADCIYKYVTNKGILSCEQFRAKREVPRRRKKSAAPNKSYRNKNQVSGTRQSGRRQTVNYSGFEPKRFVRRFLTKKLKQNIRQHELKGIWTSYSCPETEHSAKVPVIVLSTIVPDNLKQYGHNIDEYKFDECERDAIAAEAKEFKCKWCSFHCLNVPSLREHCFDYHGKIFPTVI